MSAVFKYTAKQAVDCRNMVVVTVNGCVIICVVFALLAVYCVRQNFDFLE